VLDSRSFACEWLLLAAAVGTTAMSASASVENSRMLSVGVFWRQLGFDSGVAAAVMAWVEAQANDDVS